MTFLAHIGALAGLLSFIYFLFAKAQENLRSDAKQAIADWLLRLDISKFAASWPLHFGRVFDSIFGERHLSMKCFLRSSIASCVAVSISLLIFYTTNGAIIDLVVAVWLGDPKYLETLSGSDLDGIDSEEEIGTLLFLAYIFAEGHFFGFLLIILFGMLINVFPDYFALWKTRSVLDLIGRQRRAGAFLLILIADLIATTLIFLVFLEIVVRSPLIAYLDDDLGGLVWSFTFGLPITLFAAFGPENADAIAEVAVIGWLIMAESSSIDVYEEAFRSFGIVYFMSTFFTSIWGALYFMSGMILRRADKVWIYTKGILDIDQKPLTSMGFVAVILVAVIYLTVVMVMG